MGTGESVPNVENGKEDAVRTCSHPCLAFWGNQTLRRAMLLAVPSPVILFLFLEGIQLIAKSRTFVDPAFVFPSLQNHI